VRRGGGAIGSRALIPDPLRRRLEARWTEVLAERTGCASYAEMRRAYQAERPETPPTAYAAEGPRVKTGWFRGS